MFKKKFCFFLSFVLFFFSFFNYNIDFLKVYASAYTFGQDWSRTLTIEEYTIKIDAVYDPSFDENRCYLISYEIINNKYGKSESVAFHGRNIIVYAFDFTNLDGRYNTGLHIGVLEVHDVDTFNCYYDGSNYYYYCTFAGNGYCFRKFGYHKDGAYSSWSSNLGDNWKYYAGGSSGGPNSIWSPLNLQFSSCDIFASDGTVENGNYISNGDLIYEGDIFTSVPSVPQPPVVVEPDKNLYRDWVIEHSNDFIYFLTKERIYVYSSESGSYDVDDDNVYKDADGVYYYQYHLFFTPVESDVAYGYLTYPSSGDFASQISFETEYHTKYSPLFDDIDIYEFLYKSFNHIYTYYDKLDTFIGPYWYDLDYKTVVPSATPTPILDIPGFQYIQDYPNYVYNLVTSLFKSDYMGDYVVACNRGIPYIRNESDMILGEYDTFYLDYYNYDYMLKSVKGDINAIFDKYCFKPFSFDFNGVLLPAPSPAPTSSPSENVFFPVLLPLLPAVSSGGIEDGNTDNGKVIDTTFFDIVINFLYRFKQFTDSFFNKLISALRVFFIPSKSDFQECYLRAVSAVPFVSDIHDLFFEPIQDVLDDNAAADEQPEFVLEFSTLEGSAFQMSDYHFKLDINPKVLDTFRTISGSLLLAFFGLSEFKKLYKLLETT